ncbi:MAG: Gfo/Idh/MocA family oxidoreductase [Spirochaetia bacterium]|nr:Gfo/Idh/MocA family oxidoreductase [Spirochaetia bacterium]
MKDLNIVFIGAGEISDRFIVMASKLDGVRAGAVWSRHLKNAEKKAEKYSIPRYYDDLTMMLKTEKADCAVITTPHSCHADDAIAAMKAGCHVLVEKPFATSFSDAKRMVAAAKKYGKLIMGLPFDHYPHYLRALDFIKEKYIGKILSGHSELSVQGPPRNNWYYNGKIAKGGAVIDVGCYALSRLISIMGPVRKVSAFINMLIPKRILPNGDRITPSVDDNAFMMLEFDGGVFASVKASWAHTHYENYTAIYGRKGAVYINADNRQLIVKTDAKVKGKHVKFRNFDNCYIPDGFPEFNPEDDILGKFIGCVRSGTEPVYGAMQSLHIMEVMDKAYLSAKTGKAQKITTDFKMWWPKEKTIQKFNEYI